MTLDEAILHAEEVADYHDRIKQIKAVTLGECRCADEHRQLAEWLKELKAYKEQQPCEDAISRKVALEAILTRVPDFCGDEGGNLIGRNETASYIRNLPPVTPKQKTGEWIELKDHKPEALEDVLVKDIDGDVTCAYLCDDIDFLEHFSGEIIDDVVEWMEIPR